MRAFVFPGQGSQSVGMGRSLYENFSIARDVFQEIDDTLNQHLSRMMFEGPAEDLTLTENAQPALMAVSLALVSILIRDGSFDLTQQVTYVAGHSLGEYSALASVGVFNISQAAILLKKRGQAMQAATPVGQGGMVALLGAPLSDVEALIQDAAQGQVCEIANDNAPGQIVISGHQGALNRCLAMAKERGFKRALALPVSAPFHCSLMTPAAQEMGKTLQEVSFNRAILPVITNVTASPEQRPDILKSLLVQQITQQVKWRESVLHLKELGVTHIYEIGAGKVLTGLTKRIDDSLHAISITEPADIESFLKTL